MAAGHRVMLLAGIAAAGLGGCRAEPSDSRYNAATKSSQPRSATDSAQPQRTGPRPIDFASDRYLKDVCRDDLGDLPFKRFKSYDFVYGSPLPVRVSGTYYEVRSKGAADASTIYEEIAATIFRDVEMVVEAEQTAPHFSFDRWSVPFAVSNYPFSPSRQLQHRRAMGSTFPFLDLADLDSPNNGGSDFSRNFISTLNFLASRGENIWGRTDAFERREKAHRIREATTATDYERPMAISDDVLNALRLIPLDVKPDLHGRGHYVLISLGAPARFVAAIDTSKSAVGLRACNGVV